VLQIGRRVKLLQLSDCNVLDVPCSRNCGSHLLGPVLDFYSHTRLPAEVAHESIFS